MNPFYGAALERARAEDSDESDGAALGDEERGVPQFGDLVYRYAPAENDDSQTSDDVYRHDYNNPLSQPQFAQEHHASTTKSPLQNGHHPTLRQAHPARKLSHEAQQPSSHQYVTVYPHEKRIGGSPSWRNNNPANIMYWRFAKAHGAIGKDVKGRAIFLSMEAGRSAQDALWDTKTYQSLTIEQAGKRWTHNDPPYVQRAYISALSKASDAPVSTPIWYLSPDQREWLKAAQRRQEGFEPGITEPIAHKP